MLSTIQYFSFDNIWYWSTFLLLWTLSAHRFLGVPYYYWILAKKGDLDVRTYIEMVAPNSARISVQHIQLRSPFIVFGAIGFIFSFWAVTGFRYDHEYLQSTFLLIAPLFLALLLRIPLARAIADGPHDFDAMFVTVRRYRRIHMVIAAGVIFGATMYGLIYDFIHGGVLA